MTSDNPTKNESLPELPLSFGDHCVADSVRVMREPGYTALQMVTYGRACYEAALTREAPTEAEPFAWAYEEKGGYRDEAWVERVTRGPLPCWETRNQIPLFATPPAPQRLAQGEVWTAEMVADVHRRGDELHQRITQPPHQDRGECYCQSCKGSGEVIGLHASPSGDPQDAYEAPMACPKCDGTGDAK